MAKKTIKSGERVRIIACSDFHCGHRAGLTPPVYWESTRLPWGRNQRALWKWFEKAVAAEGPFDIGLFNSDLIDGPGHKSGSSEHVRVSEVEQMEMALEAIHVIDAKEAFITYGTPYHTGIANDFEALIGKTVKAKHAAHFDLSINGLRFNVRHHTGRSSIPYGQSPVAKERMWDALAAIRNGETPADIYIRSHVHQFRIYGDGDYLAMTLPALQGPGSKFGRRCSGDYTVGFVVFDIDPDGGYQWKLVRAKLPAGPERAKFVYSHGKTRPS